jgi:hypothetical protein
MTWGCPHEINGYCSRRKLSCVPGEKGCILRGNYKFVQDEPRANKDCKSADAISACKKPK